MRNTYSILYNSNHVLYCTALWAALIHTFIYNIIPAVITFFVWLSSNFVILFWYTYFFIYLTREDFVFSSPTL